MKTIVKPIVDSFGKTTKHGREIAKWLNDRGDDKEPFSKAAQ